MLFMCKPTFCLEHLLNTLAAWGILHQNDRTNEYSNCSNDNYPPAQIIPKINKRILVL